MRPIAWGFIAMIAGAILWILFSIVYGIGAVVAGKVSAEGMVLIYIFGAMFLFSLPVAIVVEIVQWIGRRKKKTLAVPVAQSAVPTTPAGQPVFYCTNCSKPLTYVSQYQRYYCENCRTYAPT